MAASRRSQKKRSLDSIRAEHVLCSYSIPRETSYLLSNFCFVEPCADPPDSRIGNRLCGNGLYCPVVRLSFEVPRSFYRVHLAMLLAVAVAVNYNPFSDTVLRLVRIVVLGYHLQVVRRMGNFLLYRLDLIC